MPDILEMSDDEFRSNSLQLEASVDSTTDNTPESDNNENNVIPNQVEVPDDQSSSGSAEIQEPVIEPVNENIQQNQTDIQQDNVETEQPDYKQFYDQIMKPFKADGNMIQLKSADEVINLMQKGVNYTRKMQALNPKRKILEFLEQEQLLDNDKLSFLADLNKHNVNAIKKLIKDSKIDTYDLTSDLDEDITYTPSTSVDNISDTYTEFKEVLEELSQEDSGKAIISSANTEWDQASKELIYNNPNILIELNKQYKDGTYNFITNEVKRMQAIGSLPNEISRSFLKSYKYVGDLLYQQYMSQHPQNINNQQIVAPYQQYTSFNPNLNYPISSRPYIANNSYNNNQQIKRITPVRTTPTATAGQMDDPFNMSDEEFRKKFGNSFSVNRGYY